MKNSLILLFAVLLLGSAARAADGTNKESYAYARTVLVDLPAVRPDLQTANFAGQVPLRPTTPLPCLQGAARTVHAVGLLRTKT